MNVFITGGAGFIGCNAAKFFLDKGNQVFIFDNLSRIGSKQNLLWLKTLNKKLIVAVGDIRNTRDIDKCIKFISEADVILHLAGQVAVTTSVLNPREDFEINALGTFNILESIRKTHSQAKVIYASTNKVYGTLNDVEVIEKNTRYAFKAKKYGISENQNLDFHSPYGCSKGTADQYVHDYSRIYDLDTVIFRQSCIYGQRQFGIEDQGWAAWFMIAQLLKKPVTIYGNGKQVRDILYIDDLIEAFYKVIISGTKTKGKIYNIGGGPANTISIWQEFGPMLENLFSRKIHVSYLDVRPGDQPIYISDIRKAKQDFAWEPKTDIARGLLKLKNWISSNKELFK